MKCIKCNSKTDTVRLRNQGELTLCWHCNKCNSTQCVSWIRVISISIFVWVISTVLQIPAEIFLSHHLTLSAGGEYLIGVIIFIILETIAIILLPVTKLSNNNSKEFDGK